MYSFLLLLYHFSTRVLPTWWGVGWVGGSKSKRKILKDHLKNTSLDLKQSHGVTLFMTDEGFGE